MSNLPSRDAGAMPWTPFLTGVAGFFISLALLLGILGGYILGALVLLLGAVAAPMIATVVLARWLMRPRATHVSGDAPLPVNGTAVVNAGLEPSRLRNADILADLSDADLARVAAIGQEIHLPQGAMLARQGETGSALYIILEGRAQLTAGSVRGEITLRIAGPGESLPLAALLGSGKLISTACAMTDLEAVLLPRDSFLRLCQQQPNIGSSVYRSIADILAGRYQNSLSRLVVTVEQALGQPDVFANV